MGLAKLGALAWALKDKKAFVCLRSVSPAHTVADAGCNCRPLAGVNREGSGSPGTAMVGCDACTHPKAWIFPGTQGGAEGGGSRFGVRRRRWLWFSGRARVCQQPSRLKAVQRVAAWDANVWRTGRGVGGVVETVVLTLEAEKQSAAVLHGAGVVAAGRPREGGLKQ